MYWAMKHAKKKLLCFRKFVSLSWLSSTLFVFLNDNDYVSDWRWWHTPKYISEMLQIVFFLLFGWESQRTFSYIIFSQACRSTGISRMTHLRISITNLHNLVPTTIIPLSAFEKYSFCSLFCSVLHRCRGIKGFRVKPP